MGTRGFVGFIQNKEIKGWYNHFDSYPSGLGELIVEHTNELTKEQLTEFFTKKLTFVEANDDKYREEYMNHKKVFEIDWTKDNIRLQDGGDFYKDALFCEYSYIFDLDAKESTLLIFKGFGDEPSKGYEDWFYENDDGKKYYSTACGKITFSGNKDKTLAEMYIAFEEAGDSDDEERKQLTDALKATLKLPPEKLPPLVGKIKALNTKGYSDELVDLGCKIIESRLKGKY